MEHKLHPIYGSKNVRAIFQPLDYSGLNDGAKQMVGHEFVWRHVGYSQEMPVWEPADSEDIAAYFEVVDKPRPEWRFLWILEEDLDIMRVEKLDA